MKLKKTAMAVVAGACLLTAMGTAGAATREVNIYGASAEFGFWNAMAPTFLTARGCSNITSAQDTTTSPTHGIAIGHSCSSYNGDDVIIRYSSKSSYDGLYALKGEADTDGCGNAYQRKLANEATISGSTVSGTKCVDVVVAAADVAGESITQGTWGAL